MQSQWPSERVARKLKQDIRGGAWGIGEPLPSTRSLGKQYGVSSNTIVAAFRKLEAENLVESLPRKGRYVRDPDADQPGDTSVKTQIAVVSVITPPAADSTIPADQYWGSHIVQAFQRVVNGRGYGLTMLPIHRGQADALEAFEDRFDPIRSHHAGALLFAEPTIVPLCSRLDRLGLPWVMMNTTDAKATHNFVAAENLAGGDAVAARFAQRDFERVLILTPDITQSISLSDKVNGFVRGYIARRRSIKGIELGWCDSVESQHGYDQTVRYLEEHGRPPQGIFAIGDYLAVGAIRACFDRGLDVPGDVSVVGGTGLSLAAEFRPALSVMAQPMTQMGEAAADMLLHMVREGMRRLRGRRIAGEFIDRESLCGLPDPTLEPSRRRVSAD